MSKFGWSLPAGCHTLPGEEPEEPIAQKCPSCGAFLSFDPSRIEPWEESFVNENGEKTILAADSHLFYLCIKCGEETKSPLLIFA